VILVDTSVWVDHLRVGEPMLAALLERTGVLGHVFVRGELACGNLRRRREILDFLDELPQAPVATDREVMDLIERASLMGRGIGYVDAHLLASALLVPGVNLWTHDVRLADVATELGVGFRPRD
jgi:predicted nucleic acid-binding protein